MSSTSSYRRMLPSIVVSGTQSIRLCIHLYCRALQPKINPHPKVGANARGDSDYSVESRVCYLGLLFIGELEFHFKVRFIDELELNFKVRKSERC